MICVANTHLLFNPKRGDIKLGQLTVLFQGIEEIIKSSKSDPNAIIPVAICGDFNFTTDSLRTIQ